MKKLQSRDSRYEIAGTASSQRKCIPIGEPSFEGAAGCLGKIFIISIRLRRVGVCLAQQRVPFQAKSMRGFRVSSGEFMPGIRRDIRCRLFYRAEIIRDLTTLL